MKVNVHRGERCLVSGISSSSFAINDDGHGPYYTVLSSARSAPLREKLASNDDGEMVSHGGTETQRRDFVYDGWNPVRELITDNGSLTTNYFCWGTDLSGSLQGAGGVGGLLAVMVDGATPATYYPCYDANGNVTAYIDELGAVRGEYAFDAFGQTIAQSGDLAAIFSHRFSTKYFDPETGLYDYGYRFYSPELGRWLSRDPIEEEGGVNVYGFVGNNPVLFNDFLGLLFDGTADRYGDNIIAQMYKDNDEVAGWAIGGLNSFQRSLSPSLFWNMSGGNNLITALQGELLTAARGIRFRKGFFNSNEIGGEFDPSDMRISYVENSGPESVVHELIHSYRRRQTSYWNYKNKFEEGVAHLSRRYHSAGKSFKDFERNYLSSAAVKDKDELERGIRLHWNGAWSAINFNNPIHTFPYGGDNRYEAQHWNAFMQTFSMKVSCQQIAKEYNTLLALRGSTCLRLTCSEKKEGEHDVPIWFKLPDSLK